VGENAICYFVGFDVDKARMVPGNKEVFLEKAMNRFRTFLAAYSGAQSSESEFSYEHYKWSQLPKEVFEGIGGKDVAKLRRREMFPERYRKPEPEPEPEPEALDTGGADTGPEAKDLSAATATDGTSESKTDTEEGTGAVVAGHEGEGGGEPVVPTGNPQDQAGQEQKQEQKQEQEQAEGKEGEERGEGEGVGEGGGVIDEAGLESTRSMRKRIKREWEDTQSACVANLMPPHTVAALTATEALISTDRRVASVTWQMQQG
jgi:hypothetical protein